MRHQRGFTLPEMLVASLMASIVLLALTGVFMTGLKGMADQAENSRTLGSAQSAMARLERDILMARSASSSATPLTRLDLLVPVFNASGDITANNDWVTYRLDGDSLKVQTWPFGAAQPNREQILISKGASTSAALFSYLTESGGVVTMTTPEQAELVRTSLLVLGDRPSSRPRLFQAEFRLRNRR